MATANAIGGNAAIAIRECAFSVSRVIGSEAFKKELTFALS
jgi:hypothetical protein